LLSAQHLNRGRGRLRGGAFLDDHQHVRTVPGPNLDGTVEGRQDDLGFAIDNEALFVPLDKSPEIGAGDVDAAH